MVGRVGGVRQGGRSRRRGPSGSVCEAAERGAGALVTTHSMEEAHECDRLVVLASGRLVAEGSVADLVGAAQATVVESPDWMAAFDALDRAGLEAALVGRTLRVPGADPVDVRRALGELPARVHREPMTLTERFVELIRDRATLPALEARRTV